MTAEFATGSFGRSLCEQTVGTHHSVGVTFITVVRRAVSPRDRLKPTLLYVLVTDKGGI
jgi:hypothetical protein